MKYDYWEWSNFLNKEEIQKINNFLKNSSFDDEPEFCAAKSEGKKKKFLKTKIIPWPAISNFFPNLWDKVERINMENFGYSITSFNNFTEMVNYNIYSSKNKDNYDWHVDGTLNPLIDIKFTILINLSNKPYKGGDFKIFNNTEYKIPTINTPGNMIMFKSFLNHKVEKITEGERITLAIFVKGPAFK
jgi:hypothetical protein